MLTGYQKKKSFKRKEGLVFDTPFAFILIPFVQIMTSTATALVRDNFDSISEVKSEANCVYHKCWLSTIRVVSWWCQERRGRIKALNLPRPRKPSQIRRVSQHQLDSTASKLNGSCRHQDCSTLRGRQPSIVIWWISTIVQWERISRMHVKSKREF